MLISKICVCQRTPMTNLMAYEGDNIKKETLEKDRVNKRKEWKHTEILTDQALCVMLRASWGRRGSEPSLL